MSENKPEVHIQICIRCGWEFIPTRARRDTGGKIVEVVLPKTCPNIKCNSPYWNRARTKKVKEE